MATDYKLSYTAVEIDEKLGMVDELSENKADKTEVESLVSSHNTATDAHADIRAEISQLSSEIIDEIADYVMRKTDKDDNLNTGARAIESIINYIFEDIWYKALQKEDDEKYTFKLLEGITEDNLKYEILN